MGGWLNAVLLSTLVAAVDIADIAPRDVSSCPGYVASNVETFGRGLRADLSLAGKACNAYGDDLEELILEVTYETKDRIHVKIQDKGNQVYQVPESVFPRPGRKCATSNSSNIKFEYEEEPFSFSIKRTDTDEVLFDTSAAALVFESQYLRLRTSLPDDPYLYGLGEHNDPMRLNTTNYVRTLWNQDSYGIPEGANLYGAQPVYLEHRETGTHGVLFLNSNGMDVIIDRDNNGNQYLEYNTLGGVLDLYFFAAPTPIEAAQKYSEIAGLPALSPYWGLGFQQCKYGYRDVFEVAEVVYNYSQANIPLEVMWTDIDYMDRRRVFSLDPERYPIEKVRALVDHLHENDQHYIVMVDPAVAYVESDTLSRGIEDDIWLLHSNGSVWLGVVWPGVTVFPDWFAKNIGKYWNNEFALFFDKDEGVDIDGLWIDMNEPSSFPCFFPCDDPYGSAKGYPPEPPPVREFPRELPGFPCALQPEGTECEDGSVAGSSKRDTSLLHTAEYIARDTKFNNLRAPALPRQSDGDQKGLPDRDLLYPEYAIHNKAAFKDSWNAAEGGISNKTVLTDVIHQNGLAEYDVHNLYGAMMSTASYDAMLARRPGLRPYVITRSTFPGAGHKVGHWLGDNLSNWDQYRQSIRTMLAFTSIFQFGMVGSDVCGFGGNTTEELCARWASLGAFQTFYRNHGQFEFSYQEFFLWDTVAESARKAIDIRYRLLDYMYTALWRQSKDGTPAILPMFYIYPEDKNTWDLELQYFYGQGVIVAPVLDEGETSVDVYLPKGLFYDWYTHEAIEGKGDTITIAEQDTTMIPLLIRGGVIIPLRAASAATTTAVRDEDFELLIPLDEEGKASGELYIDDGVSIEQKSHTLVKFSYEKGSLRLQGTISEEWPLAIAKITVLSPKGDELEKKVGETFTAEATIAVVE
uniref:Probable alpha/beta-glucosidase agdC n=1 Tax=Sarocladium implicatum TaxID=1610689 RepID=Q75QW0_9HYPO|nr:alpha-glucosidase [Sarocladium implicatum]